VVKPRLPEWLEKTVSGHDDHHRHPRRHERDTAKALGGRRQPGSGSMKTAKGDVRDVASGAFEFLVECKRTKNQTLTVQGNWLNKITSEAGVLEPALAIRFDPEVLSHLTKPGQATAEADWVAIPRSVFRRMLDALGQEDVTWD